MKRRRLIGSLIAAYERGRRDARAGRYTHVQPSDSDGIRTAYRAGLDDERERMRLAGKLAQGELALEM